MALDQETKWRQKYVWQQKGWVSYLDLHACPSGRAATELDSDKYSYQDDWQQRGWITFYKTILLVVSL